MFHEHPNIIILACSTDAYDSVRVRGMEMKWTDFFFFSFSVQPA